MTGIWRIALRVSGYTREAGQRNLIAAWLLAIGLLALPGAATAAVRTDRSGSTCPSASSLESHTNEDPALQAYYAVSGNKATYSITTTNGPGEGTSGLIAYCVYTSPLPESTEASYSNSHGAWAAGSGSGFFDFTRSHGNADNLAFDGTTQVLGSATWSDTVPTTQVILLHIGDEALCTALEGKKTETCFVRPRLCHMLKGVGHFGPRGPTGINLNNNMSTCPQNGAQRKGHQVFEMTWENRTEHMHMSSLTSASYSNSGTEQTFSGTGEASVNHIPGYQLEFTFTLKEEGLYLWVLIKKADEAVQEFKLEPLNKGSKQHIS